MCGLLVFVGQVRCDEFKEALDLQFHRGPDDWGVSVVENVTLGHRRLSIIDLAKHSKQPMMSVSQDVVIVFNGEIYNFEEIKKELRTRGYQFHTSGDTEVLLNAYHCYGEKVLDKLIGMFAFVIYDLRNKTIFAARDRLGIKPLYYKNTTKGLCFSSEVKSIQSLDRSRGDLDLMSLSSYLSFRYPLIEKSFVEGVNQLEPGHYIKYKNGRLEKKQYWDCSKFIQEQSNDRGESYYVDKLKELFASSVKYRTIADVPVGAYLSGGVDSSAVVAQMAAQTERPISTFTIGFNEEGFNEFAFSREVANQFQTDHQEITISPENYFQNMMELIRIKDAPLGVPNEVPLYLMSKELKKKVTVVLSGEGADEIFGGYGRLFRSADDFEKMKSSRFRGLEGVKRKYSGREFKSELEHFLYLYRYTSVEDKADIFSNRINAMNLDERDERLFREAFDRVDGAGYATKMMYVFEKLHLPGLLQRVDATTMGASVEARVPFADHRLVEFAFTIPEKYKMKWADNKSRFKDMCGDQISEIHDTPKYILKKAFEGTLSNNILYRKKLGFPVPLSDFFVGKSLKLLQDKLLGGELVKADIVNQVKLKSFLKEDLMKDPKRAMTGWMLLNLEMYLAGR